MLILYRVELSKSSILTTFSKSRKISKKNLLSTNWETLFTPPTLHTHTAHLKPALSHILIHTISLTMIWSCPKFDFLPPALSFDVIFACSLLQNFQWHSKCSDLYYQQIVSISKCIILPPPSHKNRFDWIVSQMRRCDILGDFRYFAYLTQEV